MADSLEKPFKIAIPDTEIELLKKKLDLARFPDELEDSGKAYGVPLADIRRLTEHWKNGYDWRKHEAELNDEFPQFTRDIGVDGFGMLNVHYVHKKSDAADAIPLLFVHGWPGSFIEIRKILPLLLQASPEHPSFTVVALSLPGYGFSEAPSKKGFEGNQMAETGHKLMLALGYNEYVVQGGDWGALIGRTMAQLYGPAHVKAWHTNMPFARPPEPFKQPLLYLQHVLFKYNARDQEALESNGRFFVQESAYMRLQATKPQTVAYGLADSPASLLGWIYEKLYAWTDNYPWTDDEGASLRMYYEMVSARGEAGLFSNLETVVPTGYSHFPKETVRFPKRWYTCGFPNVIFESYHESGGHFAATERPEEVVGDLRRMFEKGGRAFNAVHDKN
ncbi:epoxide hydrolase [Coprinopsis marcescibilis]|uniref:Epoxide hydrolase n=1 Tax=Coprinopsis marcescibilis TaxID=230819 RepID=A0A5C3KXQ6_COPMA|nr:epoxide hydrolase [Coprinopsis marcescibilis]